jgi:hypothetical protein
LKSQSIIAKPHAVIRITNLIPFCREILLSMRTIIERTDISNNGLSSPSTQSSITELLLKLNKKLKRVNTSQKKKGFSPARLPLPSYRAYIWISFLTEKDNLIEHLQALAEFFRLVHEMQMMNSKLSLYHGNQLNLNIFYIPYVYKTQIKGHQIDLTIHEPMITAPVEIKRDLLLAALDGNKTSLKKVKKYCASVPYHRMENLIRGSTSLPGASPSGKNVNLDNVFDRVNREYFHGSLEKPQLTWSQKKSYRRLGTYAAQTDTVTISRTFDNGSCPDYAIDFIMYHELLHKKMGVKRANSGKHNHTKTFKELEKQFKFYVQANDFINQLAHTKKLKIFGIKIN